MGCWAEAAVETSAARPAAKAIVRKVMAVVPVDCWQLPLGVAGRPVEASGLPSCSVHAALVSAASQAAKWPAISAPVAIHTSP